MSADQKGKRATRTTQGASSDLGDSKKSKKEKTVIAEPSREKVLERRSEKDVVYRTQMNSVKGKRSTLGGSSDETMIKSLEVRSATPSMCKSVEGARKPRSTMEEKKEEKKEEREREEEEKPEDFEQLSLRDRIVKKATFTVVYATAFFVGLLFFAAVIMSVEHHVFPPPSHCEVSVFGRNSSAMMNQLQTCKQVSTRPMPYIGLLEGAYFVWTLFTTVGYGELFASTVVGKSMTILAAFVMCPFYLAVKAEFGQWLTDICYDGTTNFFRFLHRHSKHRYEKFVAPSGGVRTIIYLGFFAAHMSLTTLVTFFIDGSFYSLFDVFYFNIITVMGIGLGDLVPHPDRRWLFLFYMGFLHLFGDTYLSHIMVYLQDRIRQFLKFFITKVCVCVKFPHKIETVKESNEDEGRYFNVMKNAVPTRPEHMTQRNEQEQRQVEELQRIDRLNEELEAMFKKNAAVKEDVDKAAGEFICQVCLRKIKKNGSDEKKKKKQKKNEDMAIDEEEEMFPKKKVKKPRTNQLVSGRAVSEVLKQVPTATTPEQERLLTAPDTIHADATQASSVTRTPKPGGNLRVERTMDDEQNRVSLNIAPTVGSDEEHEPPRQRRNMLKSSGRGKRRPSKKHKRDKSVEPTKDDESIKQQPKPRPPAATNPTVNTTTSNHHSLDTARGKERVPDREKGIDHTQRHSLAPTHHGLVLPDRERGLHPTQRHSLAPSVLDRERGLHGPAKTQDSSEDGRAKSREEHKKGVG